MILTKRIISFSIYGSDPKYANAAIESAKLQPKFYPGWVCRFYVDKSVPKNVIHSLADLGSEIVIKPKTFGHLGMFWRFEPLMDKTIERFIVRDTDSRLNIREKAAVDEWILNGSEFHIMRDHLDHEAKICGGMWGATNEFIEKESGVFESEVEEFIASIPFNEIESARGMYFNADQLWLWKYIWPKIEKSHIAHIKDLPNLRFTGKELLFPIENPDESFVGQQFEF
jgi:hypothetical protein